MKQLPVLVLVPALLTAGCNLAPRYARPAAPVPMSWPAGAAYQHPQNAVPAAMTWETYFTDPRLARIIAAGLQENRDLRAALANMRSARAQYRVQRAALFPAIDASGGATFAGGKGNARPDSQYSADVGFSAFEIDLFGRLRNQTKAAFEQYLATEEGVRATQIGLIAEIASAYAVLAADQDALRVSKDMVASAERSLKLTSDLNAAGIAGKLDVHQAETVLESVRADVESGTTQVAQDRNALDLLVGKPVEDALLPKSLADLSPGIGAPPPGLSSDILLRRPDVLEAEHQLKAANADIGAARAAFFPTISLTALAGVASTALSSLFTNNAFSWSAAPSASLSIFGGGKVARLKYSKAQRDLYLAQYEKAIQAAFRDVADALARAGTIDRELAARQGALKAAEQSYTLSDQRYRAGIDPYLTSLDSQRTLLAARQAWININLTAAYNRITLYRVIGGT